MPPVPGRLHLGVRKRSSSVKELSKCLVLRGYRILDCPQFLCRLSLHCRLLSFQVGCIFPEEPIQPVLSSFGLKDESPHLLYANSSRSQDNPCRVWPPLRYARHHHNSSVARQSLQATSRQAQTFCRQLAICAVLSQLPTGETPLPHHPLQLHPQQVAMRTVQTDWAR